MDTVMDHPAPAHIDPADTYRAVFGSLGYLGGVPVGHRGCAGALIPMEVRRHIRTDASGKERVWFCGYVCIPGCNLPKMDPRKVSAELSGMLSEEDLGKLPCDVSHYRRIDLPDGPGTIPRNGVAVLLGIPLDNGRSIHVHCSDSRAEVAPVIPGNEEQPLSSGKDIPQELHPADVDDLLADNGVGLRLLLVLCLQPTEDTSCRFVGRLLFDRGRPDGFHLIQSGVPALEGVGNARSEERRVGKECAA